MTRLSARLCALVAAIVAALAVTVVATTAPADAYNASTHHLYLRSAYNWRYVSTEAGWSGDGNVHAKNVMRARATTPGPWEGYQIISLGGNKVALWSDADKGYVTAEFAWGTANGLDQKGTLHARPGQNTVGQWETFYLNDADPGNFSLIACENATTCWYVTSEQNWAGDAYGVLRAARNAAGPWEQFTEGPGPQNLDVGDDYPAAWKNAGQDSIHNAFGLNRECDSFVGWKIYRNSGGRQTPTGNAAPSDYATYSVNVDQIGPDAGDWSANAPGMGIRTDRQPSPGSAAQWNIGTDGMKHGHIGVVTAVHTNSSGAVTSIDIENYNLNLDGRYSRFTMYPGQKYAGWLDWPDNFIHVNGF